MIANHPDLLFAIIRNTIPNLALGRTGFCHPVSGRAGSAEPARCFQRNLRPDDRSVGRSVHAGARLHEINQRDKGIMRAFMRMEDFPSVRQKVRQLANDAVESQIYTSNQIDIVSTLSRLVPIKLD
jgi:hypothetical protein